MTDLDDINKGYYNPGPIATDQLEPKHLSPYNINALEELKEYGHLTPLHTQYIKRKFNIPVANLNWQYPYIREAESKNFDKDPWVYTSNAYGFRDVWKQKAKRPNIGFYGCSFTFGEGVESKKLWTTKVAKNYKFNNFNFGIGGASALKIARTFIATNRVLNLHKAIILLPTMKRIDYCLVYNNQDSDFTRSSGFLPNFKPEQVIKEGEGLIKKHKLLYTAFDDNLFIMNLIYAVSMITECAKAHNVNIVIATWDTETLYTLGKIYAGNLYPNLAMNSKGIKGADERARDDSHPGTVLHQIFADDIIEWINTNNRKINF